MTRGSRAFVLACTLLILCVVAIGLEGARRPAQTPVEPVYFHALSGPLILGDASLQAKAVAARRHAPLADIRHLLDEYAENNSPSPAVDRRIDVQGLNQRLDERWPIK